MVEHDLAPLARALSDDPDPERELGARGLVGVHGVAREPLEARRPPGPVEQVERRSLRVHDRRQLGQDQPPDLEQVALPLQHAAELARDSS